MRWRDACVRDLPQADAELRLRRRGQATETEKEASVFFPALFCWCLGATWLGVGHRMLDIAEAGSSFTFFLFANSRIGRSMSEHWKIA